MMLGKLDGYRQKNQSKLLSHTMYKNKFKMDQRLNARPGTIKLLEENIGSILSDLSLRNILGVMTPQVRETKAKINK